MLLLLSVNDGTSLSVVWEYSMICIRLFILQFFGVGPMLLFYFILFFSSIATSFIDTQPWECLIFHILFQFHQVSYPFPVNLFVNNSTSPHFCFHFRILLFLIFFIPSSKSLPSILLLDWGWVP